MWNIKQNLTNEQTNKKSGEQKPSLIQQNSDYQRGRRGGHRESKGDQIRVMKRDYRKYAHNGMQVVL